MATQAGATTVVTTTWVEFTDKTKRKKKAGVVISLPRRVESFSSNHADAEAFTKVLRRAGYKVTRIYMTFTEV